MVTCALRCHLVGIQPAGDATRWSRTACEVMTDVLNNKSVYILPKVRQAHSSHLFKPQERNTECIYTVKPAYIIYTIIGFEFKSIGSQQSEVSGFCAILMVT